MNNGRKNVFDSQWNCYEALFQAGEQLNFDIARLISYDKEQLEACAVMALEKMIEALGHEAFEIRQKRDLEQEFDGLILPGGHRLHSGT